MACPSNLFSILSNNIYYHISKSYYIDYSIQQLVKYINHSIHINHPNLSSDNLRSAKSKIWVGFGI